MDEEVQDTAVTEEVDSSTDSATETESTDYEETSEETEVTEDSESEEADEATDDRDWKREAENLKRALKEERDKRRRDAQSQRPAPSLQPDENGYVDPQQLQQVIDYRANQIVQYQLSEQRQLQEAQTEFPELAEDEDLLEAVQSYRNAKLVKDGTQLSYTEAARTILGKARERVTKAREQGREEAKTSTRIQKRAAIDAPKQKVVDAKTEELNRLSQQMLKGSRQERDSARIRYLELLEE